MSSANLLCLLRPNADAPVGADPRNTPTKTCLNNFPDHPPPKSYFQV